MMILICCTTIGLNAMHIQEADYIQDEVQLQDRTQELRLAFRVSLYQARKQARIRTNTGIMSVAFLTFCLGLGYVVWKL